MKKVLISLLFGLTFAFGCKDLAMTSNDACENNADCAGGKVCDLTQGVCVDADTWQGTDSVTTTETDTETEIVTGTATETATATETIIETATETETETESDSEISTDDTELSALEELINSLKDPNILEQYSCPVYVAQTGNDENFANSWDTSFETIQSALVVADALIKTDERFETCEIWVATGEYSNGNQCDSTFSIPAGVHLYGGFAGTETAIDQRDIEANPTQLATDRGHYIVSVKNTSSQQVTLDGFIVKSGNMFQNAGCSVDFINNIKVSLGDSVEEYRTVTMNIENADIAIENFVIIDVSEYVSVGTRDESVLYIINSTVNFSRINFNSDGETAAIHIEDSVVNIIEGDFHDCGVYEFAVLIRVVRSQVRVQNTHFEQNSPYINISALDSQLLIQDSVFKESGGIRIGGVSELNMTGCQFIDCQSFIGKMMGQQEFVFVGESSIATIANSHFISTHVFTPENDDSAGGIGVLGTVNVYNCFFSGLRAGKGGAINVRGGNVNISNCTIVDNFAYVGGGIYVTGGSAVVRNSILYGNVAETQSDGVFLDDNSFSLGKMSIANSNVQGGCESIAGAVCLEGNLDEDPLFVDSVAGDYNLQSSSLLIDAGSNELLPLDTLDLDSDSDTAEPLPVDLAGQLRILGDGVDMGAFEYLPAE